ncbi:uncharacterized protein LOC114145820 [Xiphophorus couchianus]|uniref:uncharacterized protein LOC114145820 n=1 Tax=Xiphophorus couchianus TaxID=32473 RepID=UPI001016345F|nr:uncharacterized protein LOC114145820 [Xiphophorus couchianus]
MRFFTFVLIFFNHLSSALPLHVDAIIVQIQQWGVVGAQHVAEQVLLNGISLSSPSWEVQSIIKSMSASDLLPDGISNNQTSVLRNHTVLRSRECIIEGSRLHWSDRVFCDGKVFLTLEHNNTWTAHVPEAKALKNLWDQEVEHSKIERSRLQEGCIQLMKELKLSEEESVHGIALPRFLIPILAVTAFLMLIIVTILISRGSGLIHPGGVIGSIIHYPKDITYTADEKKSCYRAL